MRISILFFISLAFGFINEYAKVLFFYFNKYRFYKKKSLLTANYSNSTPSGVLSTRSPFFSIFATS